MASIFDAIPSYNNGVSYSKYDIVKASDGRFYYSLINNNQGNLPTTLANLQSKWDGYISLNGNLIPNFFWSPSYNFSATSKPRVVRIKFGNGYEQRLKESINFNLKTLDLSFDNRSEKEALSILHFLENRNGQESFIYNIPSLYLKSSLAINTRFLCIEWESKYVSYQNYTITSTFEEVPL